MSHLYLFTLTWNGLDNLIKLKESLIPALSDVNYTWLIKDNKSSDNTVQEASTWGSNIKVIAYKNNLQNFSQGNNLLFQEASPKDNDYILLLNNDVIFNDKISIKKMIKLMDQDESIGAVGAKLLFTDTGKIQHAGVVFNERHKCPSHFRVNEVPDLNASKNRMFQCVTGAVLLTKADYYNRANYKNNVPCGMDPSYIWCFDDVDLCLSIRYNMEKKIVYCGDTNISHEESLSLKKNPANKLFMNHNVNYLKNKWADRYCLDQTMYEKDPNFNLYHKV